MDFKVLAEQLRQPSGDFGKKVAENMNSSNGLMNRAAIQELHLQPGDNILETGMGNGAFAAEILGQNQKVTYTGCDFSEIMVEESMLRNQEFVESGQAKFMVSAADTLPFADHSFNKIFTVNTIYFWQDPHKELAEMYRVLQPGGRFVIGIRPKRSMQKYPFTQYNFTLYSEEELLKLLENNHLRILKTISEQEPEQQIAEFTIQPEFLIVVAEKRS